MSVISHKGLLLIKLADPVTGLDNGQPFYICETGNENGEPLWD